MSERLYHKKIGLGSAIKAGIAFVTAPMPEATRKRITGCGGCAKRAEKLDAIAPNVNPLAKR